MIIVNATNVDSYYKKFGNIKTFYPIKFKKITGDFDLRGCDTLESLEGGPEEVTGAYHAPTYLNNLFKGSYEDIINLPNYKKIMKLGTENITSELGKRRKTLHFYTSDKNLHGVV